MTENETQPKVHPRAGDAEVLALAEGLVSALGKTFDPDGLDTLKGVAESYPDLGRDGAAEVVASLIGLIDDLMTHQVYDREALAVHVRAWRFVVSRKPDKKERAAVMEGLRAVRELYAEDPARAERAA